jgi:hypothetical protein
VSSAFALAIPASASEYAETRFFDMSELCVFDVADSITVMTVIEKTTVTASATTSAKPASSPRRRLSLLSMRLEPRAVPKEDGVSQLVRVDPDGGSSVADDEIDAERCETGAPDGV